MKIKNWIKIRAPSGKKLDVWKNTNTGMLLGIIGTSGNYRVRVYVGDKRKTIIKSKTIARAREYAIKWMKRHSHGILII